MLFDWASASDRQEGALCMQVMLKAQADLLALGVEMLFAQVQHPQADWVAPMRGEDLRAFAEANQVSASEGGPFPRLPLARMPNSTERGRHRGQGLEDELTYIECMGEAPNICVLDERGIIRWHSAGATPDPSGEIELEMVYTINAAVIFARDQLG